jgi:hypothetical protein
MNPKTLKVVFATSRKQGMKSVMVVNAWIAVIPATQEAGAGDPPPKEWTTDQVERQQNMKTCWRGFEWWKL